MVISGHSELVLLSVLVFSVFLSAHSRISISLVNFSISCIITDVSGKTISRSSSMRSAVFNRRRSVAKSCLSISSGASSSGGVALALGVSVRPPNQANYESTDASVSDNGHRVS